MGNESSTLSEEEEPRDDRINQGLVGDSEYCGFRVLGIQEQSPASAVGFVSFFDFILEANGIRLDTRDATLMELIAQSEDRPMTLQVFNVKAQTTRELQLIPSRKWPGKGLLGVTIRFDSYEGAEDQLLHVLNVADSSPAERAGLRADSDYLLGTPEHVFTNAEDLHDEILDALDGSFQCYVYNSLDDQVRIVSLVPTERWGGEGVLGAEVGHGYLHRLPSVCRDTVGSSVGFVNLPKDAKAATDAFYVAVLLGLMLLVKPPRRGENGKLSTDDVEVEEVAEPDATVGHFPSRDANQEQIGAEQFNQEGSETVAETSIELETTPPVKARYAAHLDLKFPISTVAVLAHP